MTRDLPGVALVITFFTTLFTKKKLNFWTNAPFCKFYNMIVKTSQQWFKINGKNAFGCPLRLGLYLKVECMNLSETNFSRTAESQRLWQGAICHVWTSQFDKHWRQSQKQLQKYNIRNTPAQLMKQNKDTNIFTCKNVPNSCNFLGNSQCTK